MTTPTPPTADLDLAAIRERADAATPGPWAEPEWSANPGDEGWWILYGRAGTEEYAVGLTVSYNPRAEADARFAAHARADVDALLAEVERLRGEAGRAVAEVVGTARAGELLGAELTGEMVHQGGFLSPTGAIGLRRALAQSEAERDKARAEVGRAAEWRAHSITLNSVAYRVAQALTIT
jgi:hypothetical protein